jgi:outer membrane protein assembly factor BamB
MAAMKKVVWTLAMVMCFGCMGCLPEPTEWMIEKLYDVPEKIPAGGEVKWSYEIQQTNIAKLRSMCVGTDGMIYIVTNYWPNQGPQNFEALSHKLQAMNPDGTLRWELDLDEFIGNPPLVSPDGTVYFCFISSLSTSASFKLYALNPDGTRRWMMEKAERIESIPQFDTTGTIYLLSDAKILYAVNPDGTEKWTQKLADEIYSPRCQIGLDHKLYIRFKTSGDEATNWTLRTLNLSDGSTLREFEVPEGGQPMEIGEDGTVYAEYENEIRAFNFDGTQRWSFQGKDFETLKSFKLGTEGQVYVIFQYSQKTEYTIIQPIGSVIWEEHSRICVLKADGSLQWSVPMGCNPSNLIGPDSWNPMIAADGMCYICTNSGRLHAISPEGRWKWKLDGNISVSSANLGPDGTIYLISGNTLYAVEDPGE